MINLCRKRRKAIFTCFWIPRVLLYFLVCCILTTQTAAWVWGVGGASVTKRKRARPLTARARISNPVSGGRCHLIYFNHPQEVILVLVSLYVHKGGLKPHSFHLPRVVLYSDCYQKYIRRNVCWLSQLQANLIIMSYHFITEDPGTYMWTGSLSVVSDGYYHTTTTI